MTYDILLRPFENTKVVITRCQLKGGQYNGQQMGQKANNGQINTTQKIKTWATRTLLKTGGNLWWVTSYWYFWLLTFFRLLIIQIASHILWYLMNEQRICLWLRQASALPLEIISSFLVRSNLYHGKRDKNTSSGI